MESHGFRITACWEGAVDPLGTSPLHRVLDGALRMRCLGRKGWAPGVFQWGYMLRWNDEQELQQVWSQFLADPEWEQAKRNSRRRGGEPVLVVSDRLCSRR